MKSDNLSPLPTGWDALGATAARPPADELRAPGTDEQPGAARMAHWLDAWQRASDAGAVATVHVGDPDDRFRAWNEGYDEATEQAGRRVHPGWLPIVATLAFAAGLLAGRLL